MKTLEYHWGDGTHTVFNGYTIDKYGIVTNIKTGQVISRRITNTYNRVSITHEGNRRSILVARALASTFLGKPPTEHHTADHIDRTKINDVLDNIRWLDKNGQRSNQVRSYKTKSAFIIEWNEVEYTAKELAEKLKDELTPSGNKFTDKIIRKYAQKQLYGFRYKTFSNLPGEVWKSVKDSKNKMGEWFISSKNRMKYKTIYTENIMTVDKLSKRDGYPTVRINGKQWPCHYLSMMAFRPNEYAAKEPGDIILHKNDYKLDFNPFRLRWGTPPENGIDAHKNGKYRGTKSEQKQCASYIGNVFEKDYKSLREAIRYLKEVGYTSAKVSHVGDILDTTNVRYDRTWKTFS